MSKDIYILQHDTPNLKAGAEFILSGLVYNCWAKYVGESEGYSMVTYPKEVVENTPYWFTKKEEDKIEIGELHKANQYDAFGKWYQFKSNVVIPVEKHHAITRAIEFIVNKNGVINEYPSYDTSQKKYTEEDMRKCFLLSRQVGKAQNSSTYTFTFFEDLIKELTDKK